MFYRKDAAVALAVSVVLAAAGYATAGTTESVPLVTLDAAPDAAVVNPADAAPQGFLMQGLDRIGLPQVKDAGFNIYGWLESGYTLNLRRHGDEDPIRPGPFNHEVGNHYMLNQGVLTFERQIDASKGKFDVGGKVQLTYGTDANLIHGNGLAFGNDNYTGKGGHADQDGYDPWYQLDITQAYVDVAIPVGNGITIRGGKFVTLLSYETIAPQGNPFYSHSYLFSAVPGTQTGILGMYTLNDQWAFKAGITRGWDQALEDNNGAIDFLGQVTFNPTKTIQAVLNVSVGPQDELDTSHYRTTIDPIVTWQVTDQFKLAAEVLYTYDGGLQGDPASGLTHAYGDVWGGVLYASYTINDYFTLNARIEKAHVYDKNSATDVGNQNFYEITFGTTITPLAMIKEVGKAVTIRPEIRYDVSEDHVYTVGGQGSSPEAFRDQWTVACDLIVAF